MSLLPSRISSFYSIKVPLGYGSWQFSDLEKEGTGAQWGNLNTEFGINQDRIKSPSTPFSILKLKPKKALSKNKAIHEHCRMHANAVL